MELLLKSIVENLKSIQVYIKSLSSYTHTAEDLQATPNLSDIYAGVIVTNTTFI